MSDEQFDRELKFQLSMSIVNKMLEDGTISLDDYERWLQHLVQKYDPPVGKIVSN